MAGQQTMAKLFVQTNHSAAITHKIFWGAKRKTKVIFFVALRFSRLCVVEFSLSHFNSFQARTKRKAAGSTDRAVTLINAMFLIVVNIQAESLILRPTSN